MVIMKQENILFLSILFLFFCASFAQPLLDFALLWVHPNKIRDDCVIIIGFLCLVLILHIKECSILTRSCAKITGCAWQSSTHNHKLYVFLTYCPRATWKQFFREKTTINKRAIHDSLPFLLVYLLLVLVVLANLAIFFLSFQCALFLILLDKLLRVPRNGQKMVVQTLHYRGISGCAYQSAA